VAAPFGQDGKAELHFSWCLHSENVLSVDGRSIPYRYTDTFASIDDVIAWSQKNPRALIENARLVDSIIMDNNCSLAINNLFCQTLHTFLTNTWYGVDHENSREYFGVWEGSCYYQSTIDVEYTQTPFYLSLWPELLGKELDIWPLYTVPGDRALQDDRYKDTLVVSHDYGQLSFVRSMVYGHHMPVEENANYILMLFAYWRRTGDFALVKRNIKTVIPLLELIYLCDTTGNGVPDQGMANTIDDASPAVQFGKEQVYLAVKAMAAFRTGAVMLKEAGAGDADKYLAQAEKIRAVVEGKGWKEDHFVTVLDAGAKGVKDAWSGLEGQAEDVLPGWDASHIYTVNGLALLDMLGFSTGLDEEKLARDLRSATERCLEKYGCRHSDYIPAFEELSVGEGRVKNSPRIGWISMNMLRDIAALYRGIDFRHLADRYWAYQVLMNTREISFFFETVHGNNLKYYPRGIAVWGFFDALAGLRSDKAEGRETVSPLNAEIHVPLLHSADWTRGTYKRVSGGRIVEREINPLPEKAS
jgi:hypothetical protein